MNDLKFAFRQLLKHRGIRLHRRGGVHVGGAEQVDSVEAWRTNDLLELAPESALRSRFKAPRSTAIVEPEQSAESGLLA
jgi:hypothetical protein